MEKVITAHDGALKYPQDPQFGKSGPGKIGMWIFLGDRCHVFCRASFSIWCFEGPI